MSRKSDHKCEHTISANVDFLKKVLALKPNQKLVYDTQKTKITIKNDFKDGDLRALGSWITVYLAKKGTVNATGGTAQVQNVPKNEAVKNEAVKNEAVKNEK